MRVEPVVCAALRHVARGECHGRAGGYHHPVYQGEGQGTGFKFYTPEANALQATIGWAVSTWYDRPSHVTLMREQAMEQRFEWAMSARKYLEVYQRALAKRGG